ncbi:hypothetical protein BDM02DRAFT_3130692 [Thelephora ganbajun]|uniref:Uncharacterized protein n=1 Tax=Thelephora ganbajun TaxID=370292 RepID=A0ACB6Z8L7_THEGA|nr:hypothetical protein BDM02DRAFT_3130692 [Thelephora ganbajun]
MTSYDHQRHCRLDVSTTDRCIPFHGNPISSIVAFHPSPRASKSTQALITLCNVPWPSILSDQSPAVAGGSNVLASFVPYLARLPGGEAESTVPKLDPDLVCHNTRGSCLAAKTRGGIITLNDLEGYEAISRVPVNVTYGSNRIFSTVAPSPDARLQRV